MTKEKHNKKVRSEFEEISVPRLDCDREDRQSPEISDLSAWLRSFSASTEGIELHDEPTTVEVDEMDETSEFAVTLLPRQTDVETEFTNSLPDWLSAPRSGRSDSMQSAESPEKSSLPVLIFYEDSPKKMSADSLADSRTTSDIETDDENGGISSVPLVARAWVDYFDSAQLSDGGSTFAVLASETVSSVELQARIGNGRLQEPSSKLGQPSFSDARQLKMDSLETGVGNEHETSSQLNRKLFAVVGLAVALVILGVFIFQIFI